MTKPSCHLVILSIEAELEWAEALQGLGHQGILFRLILCQISHGEAQERAGVVPRHATYGLLPNQELRDFFRIRETAVARAVRCAHIEEIRTSRHLGRETNFG